MPGGQPARHSITDTNGGEKMKNIRSIVAGACSVLCVTCLALPAQAAEVKVTGEFGWFGVGKAHQVEKGHFYWVGEFSGTFFNDKGEGSTFHRAGVKCPAWFDADFNNNKTKAGG
jgi:hypothetical protein